MKYNPKIHHRRSIRLKGYDYAKESMYFITICTENRIHFFGEVENGVMILSAFGEIAHREWEELPKRWPHIELGVFQIMPNHMHGVLLIERPHRVVEGIESMDDWAATRAAPTNPGIGTVGATLVVAPNDVVTPNDVVAPNDVVTQDNKIPPDSSLTPPDIPFSKIQWATRPYLGEIIGAYKSIVATKCLNQHKQNQPGVWIDKIWQRSFDDRIIWNAQAFDNISNYIITNPKNWKEDRFFD